AITLAPVGQAGTLLLDPSDLTIGTASDSDVSSSGTTTFTLTGTPPLTSGLSWATLSTALGNGNVLVTTVGSPNSTGQSGQIVIGSSSPDLNSANTLTIQAAGTITFLASILNSNPSGTLILNAQGEVAANSIAQGAGDTITYANLLVNAPVGRTVLTAN